MPCQQPPSAGGSLTGTGGGNDDIRHIRWHRVWVCRRLLRRMDLRPSSRLNDPSVTELRLPADWQTVKMADIWMEFGGLKWRVKVSESSLMTIITSLWQQLLYDGAHLTSRRKVITWYETMLVLTGHLRAEVTCVYTGCDVTDHQSDLFSDV